MAFSHRLVKEIILPKRMYINPWLIITVVVSVAYLLLFRQFTISHNWWIVVLIAILGAISIYGYYKVFSQGQIGVNYGIMTGSIVVLIALGGLIFFKEQLTPLSVLALGLIVSGVILLAASNQ